MRLPKLPKIIMRHLGILCIAATGMEVTMTLFTLCLMPIATLKVCEADASLCPIVDWWPLVIIGGTITKCSLLYWVGNKCIDMSIEVKE